MATALRIAAWIFRVIIFVALFGLALKNSALIELHFFFNQSWTAPVAAVLLMVFFAGTVFGLIASLSWRARVPTASHLKNVQNVQDDGN